MPPQGARRQGQLGSDRLTLLQALDQQQRFLPLQPAQGQTGGDAALFTTRREQPLGENDVGVQNFSRHVRNQPASVAQHKKPRRERNSYFAGSQRGMTQFFAVSLV